MNELKPYQARLVAEYYELRDREQKLYLTISNGGEGKVEVTSKQMELLRKQWKYMLKYERILAQRLQMENIFVRVGKG